MTYVLLISSVFVSYCLGAFIAHGQIADASTRIPESCYLDKSWEDGSRIIQCPLSGQTWIYDPDGQPYINAAGVPVYEAGWYPCEDAACTEVDHGTRED